MGCKNCTWFRKRIRTITLGILIAKLVLIFVLLSVPVVFWLILQVVFDLASMILERTVQ